MKVFGYITRSAEGKTWSVAGDMPCGLLDILITKSGTHRVMRKSDYDHVMCYPCMIPIFKAGTYLEGVQM